ncbi:hypothetical protein DSO57_1017436 [Entomophthora muscae]|uniref:Uncharacterized protein n=1 Tax=Entomophthora muscae TaxID=34485 RepID=A0ACC2UE31_9FUNG|nr:hypothetical protein DSO57_1017436 [Entomophthora muscae]
MTIAFIQGASGGIGLAFTKKLLQSSHYKIIAACRNPETLREVLSSEGIQKERLEFLKVDVTKEDTIKDAAAYVSQKYGKNSLKLVLNCSGILSEPEKSFRQLDSNNLEHVFRVNCHGPSLVYKHFFDLLESKKKPQLSSTSPSNTSLDQAHNQLPDFSIIASISAKVGSIGDNRLGGWMSYRSSKSALNMMTKCLSVELSNRKMNSIAICLHPGTVTTSFSKNFTANQPKDKLFTPEYSADCLYNVLCSRSLEDSGKVFSWDGSALPY